MAGSDARVSFLSCTDTEACTFVPSLFFSLIYLISFLCCSSPNFCCSSSSLHTCNPLLRTLEPSLGSMHHWFSYQWTLVWIRLLLALPCPEKQHEHTHTYMYQERLLQISSLCRRKKWQAMCFFAVDKETQNGKTLLEVEEGGFDGGEVQLGSTQENQWAEWQKG